jgi:pantothenate kinase
MRHDGRVTAAASPLDVLAARVSALRATRPERGDRVLIGIAGSPGSGKSTLAAELVARLGAGAIVVPMDGYHRRNAELDRLGRRDRKGAVDTFDAPGFAAAVLRLRTDDGPVGLPDFDRELDEPVDDAIVVGPEHRTVVLEGNYLLVPEEPWTVAAAAFDARWFVRVDEDLRERRLVERHVRFGRTPEAALAWAREVDGVNARLIAATEGRADLTVSGEDGRILSSTART